MAIGSNSVLRYTAKSHQNTELTDSGRPNLSLIWSNPDPLNQTVIDLPNSFAETLEATAFDLKICIAHFATRMRPEWRTNLFRQIDLLLDPDEWEDGDRVPTPASMRTYMRALFTIKSERLPSMALSSSGNLLAMWVADDNRLTIECFGHDKVRWVISHRAGEIIERIAGESAVSRILPHLNAYDRNGWF